jgi:anti-sigma regulatory factor (Ser/Thr protein kinase)
MPKKPYSFKLKSDLAELDKLSRHVQQFGNAIGLSKKFLFEINLALDELFTNIISYGFKDDRDHLIEITMIPRNNSLELCIEDDGIPFNLIEVEDPDLPCDIETCKIGGLGIHLIKNLMDEVCYTRLKDKNRLTLRKDLTEK